MKLLNRQARVIMVQDLKLIPGRPCAFEGDIETIKATYPRIARLIKAGEVVVIDEKAARQAEQKLEELTVEKLREYAAANGISLDGCTKKDAILAAIEAAQK